MDPGGRSSYMPGAKHPQKAQVIHALERTTFGAIDRIRLQRLGGKSLRASIGDRVCGVQPAEPIADPVGVAGPEDDADAGLDYCGEGGEEAAGVVACG